MLTTVLREAVARAAVKNGFPLAQGVALDPTRVPLEVPRHGSHGDYATNLALAVAKAVGQPPRQVAEALVASLDLGPDVLENATVAGPGFVNFRLSQARLGEDLARAVESAEAWGTWPGEGAAAAAPPILVEYVSANPTGPMNVVNARAAAVGAALVRLYRAAGRRADGEFFVNDAGRQVDLLGASVAARFRELQGQPAEFPEDGYQGTYVADLAAEVPVADGLAALGRADGDWFRDFALERMLAWQERSLAAYGTVFDRWSRESALHASGALATTRADLEKSGHVYEHDGATWFRSSAFGDEKDRVLVRSNGEPSYYLADIAYHRDKAARGYAQALDLWGPDHHGHVARMQAAMTALGLPAPFLRVTIVQFVPLVSRGELVKMSKRAGEFITLDDLLAEVGADCAKFFFLMRSTNSHLDFDLDLAKSQNNDNPAYYVQYAHARVASVLRVAAEKGLLPPASPAERRAAAALLVAPEERALLVAVAHFPELVRGAAEAEEPHRVTTFLAQVAAAFHQFYHEHRIVTDDLERSRARLLLVRGVQQTIHNGLALLGVTAPERM
ncbi:MAG: arginine--tRNA ligase [Candidatus Eisenbacteria bacterium]